MSADPRIVPDARPIRRLRYDELMELSHFGAKVVHPPSVHPVRACGIPLWIKSTFRPEGDGTLVSDEPAEDPGDGSFDSPIMGITSIGHVAMARLEGDGMVGVPGVSMRLFGALARRKVNVILITQGSSEHSICFAVAPEDLERAREVVEAEFEFDRRAGDIDDLYVEDDVAVIAVVGAAMCQRPGIAGRLFSVLGDRGVNVRAIAQGSSELNISLVVKREDALRATRAIHGAFFESAEAGAAAGRGRVPVVSLFVAGVGGVGGALLDQLGKLECEGDDGRRSSHGWRGQLRLEGVADSQGALVDPAGIDPGQARARLKEGRDRAVAGQPNALIEAALAGASAQRIYVDCTAADSLEEDYERLLQSGVSVVTANKKPLAGAIRSFRTLTAGGAGLYYEATVGAGLPVIRTLADLLATGDQLLRIEGVLSGTASFLTSELAGGRSFSEAVVRARDLGYTEPDPREDLAGEDVARKMLILLRLAAVSGVEGPNGRVSEVALERGDLEVEPWIPVEPWGGMSLQEFLRRMPELDDEFESRQARANQNGKRLAYVASWDGSNARIGLDEVGESSPCFALAPGENLIALSTRRYAKMPLVVRGPGAGPEVTAAGVLGDILRAVAERGKSS